MSLISKFLEVVKTAGRKVEESLNHVERGYEENSTPTDSFIQEVRNSSCPVSPITPKGHPLFPMTSVSTQGSKNPYGRREGLKKLAFQIGRERHRIEKEEGASKAAPYLMIETRIALALGDLPTANHLSVRLMEKTREMAVAKMLDPLQALAEEGELSAADLEPLKPYVALVSIECGKKIAVTPFFLKLPTSEQLEVLKDLSRLGLIADHRGQARRALLAFDEPRRLYHEAHVALLKGQTEKARVLMMDLKEKTIDAKDPELILMREEGREILRTLSLAELDSLIAFNEGITEQQTGNRYGWNIEERITGDSRDTSLKRMKGFLERGHADTLEEAYVLGRRKGSLGQIEGALVPLFLMGTREGLERLSHPVDRKRYLLEIVEKINGRDGSYGIAGKMLEDVFQEELRRALVSCPREKFEALGEEVGREKIQEEVGEAREAMETALDQKLAALKEQDPQGFAARFGEEGPSFEEKDRMLDEMEAAEVEHRVTLKIAYHLLQESHESGELKERDEFADRAWGIYNDTFDPLDEIFNLAHATSDALKKEALFTAVTLPAGLGAGVLARTTLGGTSLVVRLAAQGGFRALAAEGMIVGAGALAEGLTDLSLKALLKGEEITPGKTGLEFLSGLASGSVGRLWSRASKALKVDSEALEELVKKGGTKAEIAGRKIGGFAGSLALSTAQSTLMGEIEILFEEEPVKTSFAERALGHLAKALINPRLEKGVHRLLGGKLEEADEAVWKRLKIAQTEFRMLQRMDPEMGDHAVSLRAEGLSGEEVLRRLHMDPSLAPLLVASDDQLESLMGEVLAGGVEERDKDFKAKHL